MSSRAWPEGATSWGYRPWKIQTWPQRMNRSLLPTLNRSPAQEDSFHRPLVAEARFQPLCQSQPVPRCIVGNVVRSSLQPKHYGGGSGARQSQRRGLTQVLGCLTWRRLLPCLRGRSPTPPPKRIREGRLCFPTDRRRKM